MITPLQPIKQGLDHHTMKEFILNSLKGALMGAANVIPGVSGGTIAVVTGIFERLIQAISKFDVAALILLKNREFKKLTKHVDLIFLSAIGTGAFISLISLARLFEYLFISQKTLVWAFFFGLIIASVYVVGKTVQKWNMQNIIFFISGSLVAGSMAILTPGTSNESTLYLLLCGAIAMCSMILPGLSGSFVLLLMGNYELLINSISRLELNILIPFGCGALFGILLFARILGSVFQNYHDQTISILTGFIFGSLAILWPWKNEILSNFNSASGSAEKVIGYTYYLPEISTETWTALAIILIGVFLILWTESISKKSTN